MEHVLDYRRDVGAGRYTRRGVIVLALAAIGVIISAGAVASAVPGGWRLRFIRFHGLRLLLMTLGPPLIAVISSIVAISGMGGGPQVQRGRRLAVTAIVLSTLNLLGIVAVPVVLALSFTMGRTLTAEERRSRVASAFDRFSAQLGASDSVVEGYRDGGRDEWYLIRFSDVPGLKEHLLALPRQVGKVTGGQTIIQQKPPRWWKIDSRKAYSVEIDTGSYDYSFYFSPETGEVYLHIHQVY